MKKLSLLLTAMLLVSPAFAGNWGYTYYTPKTVVSNAVTTYTTKNLNSSKAVSADAEFIRALMAGTALATGRLNLISNPSITTPRSALRMFLDPYIVNINGQSYVLVKDSKNNTWSAENILGYSDSRADLFESLKNLESDGDKSKLTSEELKKADIRFVLLKSGETLALNNRELDFDLNKIKYIDMKNLRTALGNKNQDGTFGYFYVIVDDNGTNRAYPGRVTFEDKKDLEKYVK